MENWIFYVVFFWHRSLEYIDCDINLSAKLALIHIKPYFHTNDIQVHCWKVKTFYYIDFKRAFYVNMTKFIVSDASEEEFQEENNKNENNE